MEKKEPASDNAAFDVHSTDPARLKAETRKDLGAEPTNWSMRITSDTGIKYAGSSQYKVVYKNEGRGIFETEAKAKEVLRKYILRGN